MKFTNTALLAMICTAAFTTAAPAPVVSESSLVTRDDANEVLNILKELQLVQNQKRSMADEAQVMDLAKREDSLVTQLISALSSSGLISDVWDTLTSDSDLKSEIVTIVKASIKGAITYGPSLIKAIINSGLISTIFEDIYNDSDLRSVLFKIAKALFADGVSLVEAYLSGSSDSSSSTAATSGATATATATTATTSALLTDINTGTTAITTDATTTDASDITIDTSDLTAVTYSSIDLDSLTTSSSKRDVEYLQKDDLSSVISSVVSTIESSGIVSTLINKVLADPEESISLLTSVLKKGLVLGEELYSWAKSSGILQEGLTWLESNGGSIVSTLASFLGELITNGTVSTSDIDSATTSSATGTTIATTATATTLTTLAAK